MRNLEHDKDVIRQLLAVTPMDIPPMFSEIAALHAIERAIAAESKVEEMQETIRILNIRLDAAYSSSKSAYDAYRAEYLKVEEMQKALEWYADENNYEMVETRIDEYSSETTSEAWKDSGERARQALKGESQ